MRPPLDGVTVVTIEHAVAAPYATRQLADLGARVRKIERPDGGDFARGYDELADGLASYFVWLNRGKESVALDLKRRAAADALRRLVAGADVFVQNLGPGAAARLGLDAATLRAADPRLITCDISGYGPDGPYADRKAYDLLVQCEGGLASVTGSPDAPAKAGVAVADLAAGTFAASGIVTALYTRERTGEGAELSIAMLDAVAEWMTFSTLFSRANGVAHPASGLAHPALVPYDGYLAADGVRVVLGIQNDREWQRLRQELALPDDDRFVTTTGRAAHRDEVDGLVGGAVAQRSSTDIASALDRAGIAFGIVRSSLDLLDHPQLAARERWRDTPTSVGPVPVLRPPVTLDGWDPPFGPVPGLGDHTLDALAELGLSDEELAEVLGPPPG